MNRFLIGVLVGALLVIAFQIVFSPPPGSSPPLAEQENAGKEPTPFSGSVTIDPGVGAVESESVETQSMTPPSALPSSIRSNATFGAATDQGLENSSEGEPAADEIDSGNPANPIRLPDTHEGFVSKKPPALPDAHAELEREAYDESWASVVEGLIARHIGTHPQGNTIGIISLQCRTTRCEIAGTAFGENGADAWKRVRDDMQQTAWYAAYLTPSTLESAGGFPGEYRFVSIFARIGNDIPPPVEP